MLLGVPNKKLLRKVIQPAEAEVDGMADFGVKIEPIRKGRGHRFPPFLVEKGLQASRKRTRN